MSPGFRNSKQESIKSNTIGSIKNSYSASSLKRNKDKKSALDNQILGYTTTPATNTFLASKHLHKYASVDNILYDTKNLSLKPSLKVKSSKLEAKQSKNSSMDDMIQRSYLDNQIKLASKKHPSNLKIKKEKIKTKKKKKDLDYLSKKLLESNMKLGQEPLSINIVNTNHLHLSGYGSNIKPSQSINTEDDKKENFHSIIKAFKPNQTALVKGSADAVQDDRKTKKFKQEIKTTKPSKHAQKSTRSNTANASKRAESETRKSLTASETHPAEKRSSSQPPVKENNNLEAKVESYVATYAFDSRTGFIPMKDDKQNQDRCFIMPNFANITNNWLFGVCDGHGINGHFASDHVKQFLPTNIELLDYMLLRQKYKEASTPAEKNPDGSGGFFDNDEEDLASYLLSKDRRKKYTVISEGFIKTACDIQNRSFNVDYSGTTVVTVMLSGNNLTCANVGDSRAILGSLRSKEDAALIEDNKDEFQIEAVAGPNSTGDKMWMSTSLSIDHKPDRTDEYERIINTDGRVDPFREENGDPVGPARVWLKTQNIPGLAMSRSIGDLVASTVGVIPEPEFFELTLNDSDKFLVLATDGVWEFIDNKECVRLVSPFWEANPPDPEGA